LRDSAEAFDDLLAQEDHGSERVHQSSQTRERSSTKLEGSNVFQTIGVKGIVPLGD
jgi:hypothetical protein